MTTLEQLLDLPRFSDLEILSAHKNLERKVESVEITETPDVANFIPKNAIVLTTAMIYKDDQSKMKHLLDTLVSKDVAALGIKVGRFIDDIDQDVVDYASKVDVPIVKVPSSQPLGRLLYQMLSYIWDAKTEQLTYALDIQKRFSGLLMHDVNLSRFIAELGKIINAPVILLSPWHKVISNSQYFSRSDHPASFYIEQIDDHHYDKINEGNSSFIVKDLKGENVQVLGYPVNVDTYFPFHLIILKPEQIPYPVSEFAIEQAILVLTFILFKNYKVDEFFDIMKSDFLSQLIKAKTDQTHDHRNWVDLGSRYGLVHSKYYRLALAYCVPNKDNKTKLIYRQEEAAIAKKWLEAQLPLRIKNVIIFKVKNTNEIALLFQSQEPDANKVLQTLADELKEALSIQLCFAFGNPYEAITNISSSFIEAKSALDEATRLFNPNVVNYYHPKGLVGLFENINEESIHYYCEKILKDLAYPNDQSQKELRNTLKHYLDYNCEITKTATALYLHRNTIKYRIKQCEKLLGLSVKDPENSLNLRLALELSESGNESSEQAEPGA